MDVVKPFDAEGSKSSIDWIRFIFLIFVLLKYFGLLPDRQ